VKIEPVGGDSARRIPPLLESEEPLSSLFLYVNTSKRLIALDLSDQESKQQLSRLIAEADLLVIDETFETKSSIEKFQKTNPALVVLSITPFGESGLYAKRAATPFTTFHSGGEGFLTPVASHLDETVATHPPLRQGRFGGEFKLAPYAVTLAMAALLHARESGQGQYVECSKQDLLIGLNFLEFQGYLTDGTVPTRSSLATPFGGIMKCADGYLQFTFHEEHQWRALVAMMGTPAWAKEPWAATASERANNAKVVNTHLGHWLETKSRDEIVHAGQAMGVTVAPYLGVDEVAAAEQMSARNFFAQITGPGGETVRFPTAPWRFDAKGPKISLPQRESANEASFLPRTNPKSDAHKPPTLGALSGVRVLDFTWAVAGPTATMILAALGAEVIKVESSSRPDVLRRSPWAGSTTNRDKKSITVNLRHRGAAELLLSLAAQCDVVAESFRPGVMSEFGLDYEAFQRANDSLVMLSSSMAGQEGPQSRFAGYAPMFVALSGLGDLTGYSDGPPTQIRVGGDVIVGIYGAFAVVSALLNRQISRKGCYIDLSSVEAQAALVGDALTDYLLTGRKQTRCGNDDSYASPQNCYRCEGTDNWVAISIENDTQWDALAKVLIDDDVHVTDSWATLERRIATREVINERIAKWCASRSLTDVCTRLRHAGVAVSPSYRADQLFADPHVRSRNMVVTVPGEGREWSLVKLGGNLSGTPLRLTQAGPALGQHSDVVLSQLLGLSDIEIGALREQGLLS
jgi:crotonobetainyl-CoA:carnitine CoA-transferase CaiB-like acyl-CoA transferase